MGRRGGEGGNGKPVTRTLFRGGQVFDARSGTLGDADLVVADGRIVDVGPGLDGDVAVDVAGRTLMPGLFDCHVHVVVSGIDVMTNLQKAFSYQFYEAARHLRLMLGVGVTTARDAGGADLGVKQAVADGLVPGPRLQIAVTMLSPTGGHGDNQFPSGHMASMFSAAHPGRPSGVVDGPEPMRKKVRELVRAGADVLKVATSGGVLSPGSDPRQGHFGDDELSVLCKEAAGAGRYVMAHALSAEGVKAALRAGARSIEHGAFLDDEAIAMLLDGDAWLVPTLLAPQGVLEAVESGAALTEASKRKITEVVAAHCDSFRRAVDAGVKVAMGTDCPVTPHGRNLEELALMTQNSAMKPGDALVAASANAAELMGLDDELGALEPGKRADVVVVRGDPFELSDLAARVEQVWQDGQHVAGATA